MIGRAQGAAEAIAILNNAYPVAKNAIDKGQIDLALCEAYSKAKRWGDVATTAKRLKASKTFDTAGYQFLMKALQAQKDWKGLETAALEETKGKIAASDAWQYVAIARMRMGNAAGAEEAIEKYKSSTSGSDGLELEVWNQVLPRKVFRVDVGDRQETRRPAAGSRFVFSSIGRSGNEEDRGCARELKAGNPE